MMGNSGKLYHLLGENCILHTCGHAVKFCWDRLLQYGPQRGPSEQLQLHIHPKHHISVHWPNNTEKTEISVFVNSASHNERHCTHVVFTQGCTGNQYDEKQTTGEQNVKKCPKMCILFHIIIQCLHTGILLRLLKESVKKSEANISLKIPPLPQNPTNKIHFNTISSKLMFCPEFIESFIST